MFQARDLEIKNKTAQLNELQSKLTSAQYQSEEAQEELKQAKLDNKAIVKESARRVKEAEAARDAEAHARAAQEAAEAALKPLEESLAAAQQTNSDQSGEIAKLRGEVAAVSAQLAAVSETLKKKESQLEVEAIMSSELDAQFKAQQAELVAQNIALESLRTEHAQLTAKMAADQQNTASIDAAIKTCTSTTHAHTGIAVQHMHIRIPHSAFRSTDAISSCACCVFSLSCIFSSFSFSCSFRSPAEG